MLGSFFLFFVHLHVQHLLVTLSLSLSPFVSVTMRIYQEVCRMCVLCIVFIGMISQSKHV
jgi:hypothetical protein